MNRPGPKIGQNLATLAGCDSALDVAVQDAEVADLGVFGTDVAVAAVHDNLTVNAPHDRRLLEASLNVICLGGDSSYPFAVDPPLATEIDDLAKEAGVTLTGCGLWDAYRIWTVKVLAGPCTSLRGLHHKSVTDVARFGPEVLRLAKIGCDPSEFRATDGGLGGRSEKPLHRVALHQAAESLGLHVAAVDLGARDLRRSRRCAGPRT